MPPAAAIGTFFQGPLLRRIFGMVIADLDLFSACGGGTPDYTVFIAFRIRIGTLAERCRIRSQTAQDQKHKRNRGKDLQFYISNQFHCPFMKFESMLNTYRRFMLFFKSSVKFFKFSLPSGRSAADIPPEKARGHRPAAAFHPVSTVRSPPASGKSPLFRPGGTCV